jgi:hypothetical protein
MKKYRVWFEQVNQSLYEVEAPSRDEAIREAGRSWLKWNFPPEVLDTEELEGETK